MIETVPTPPLKYRINHANAREMQLRSQAAKIAAKRELEDQAAKGRAATPQSVRLAKQITRLEQLMEDEDDAGTLSKLATAHQKLFDAWMVLTGTPRPGVRKTGRKERQTAMPTPQPVESCGADPASQ